MTPAIDAFIDALWLEEGLSKQHAGRVPARPDAVRAAGWPGAAARSTPRARPTCTAYFAARHAGHQGHLRQPAPDGVQALLPLGAARAPASRPTRRCACSRRKQPLRVPKTLTEAQVEALLAAPDVDTPLGLRDRTMLELMYASGLRVSELVTLKTFDVGMNDGVLRVHGQGQQGAAGAVRRGGARLDRALPGRGARRDPGRPADRGPVRHRARRRA